MKLMLKDVRLSFPDLFEATQFQGAGAFRYGATFLVEPGSANDKAIRLEIDRLALEQYKTKPKADAALKGFWGNGNKCCYIDGDTKSYDGYEGLWALSAKREQSKGRPLILDRDKTPLTSADGKPYAGCYVNTHIELWLQTKDFPGIRCTLLGVQFLRDGDAFAAGSKVTEEDFDDLGEGADASEFV